MEDTLDIGAGLTLGWYWLDGAPVFSWTWRGAWLPWLPEWGGSYALS